VTQRVHAEAEDTVVSDPVGDLELAGFTRPVRVYDIRGLDSARVTS
jgi:hypothetical protein